jgi:hypothetical protein
MLDYTLKQEFKFVGEVLNLKENKTKLKLSQLEAAEAARKENELLHPQRDKEGEFN